MISISSKQQLNETKQSQSLQDVTNDYYKELRRPRRVKFFKNGDRYYHGKNIMITPNRYLSFKELMHDLSRSVDLPYGVRRIYTPTQGHEVRDIEDLVDGSSYVCGSFEPFKAVKYGEWPEKPWNANLVHQHKHDGSSHNASILPSITPYSNNQVNGNLTAQGYYLPRNLVKGLPALTNNNNTKRTTPGPFMSLTNKQNLNQSENWTKPRLITIVKAGERPRKKISILLNRKAIHNFEQFVCDISDAFGLPQWKNDKIRKLYTIKGRRVQGISDFFRDDELFIGVSGKEGLPTSMIQDLLEELYPNNPYAQNLIKEWERIRKVPVNLNDSKNTQRDSGYADDDLSNEYQNHYEPNDSRFNDSKFNDSKLNDSNARDSKLTYSEENKKKKKKKKENEATSDVESQRHKDRLRLIDEEKRKREALQAISEKSLQKYAPTYITVIKHGSLVQETPSVQDDSINKKTRRKPKVKKPIVFQYDMENQPVKPQNEQISKDEEVAAIQPVVLPKLIDTPRHKDTKNILDATPRKLKRQISSIRYIEEKYEILKILGDGNFAVVKQARNKTNGHEYALKIIDKSKMKGKEHMIDNEIQIMRSCSHPNIVKLYDDFEAPNEVYLITELIKGGDLFDAITQSVKFNERDSAGMVKDLCEALFYLHSKNIVHRDLKPENLLVLRRKDGSITIKLADFGLAMEVKEPIYTVCGTPTYVAPEILSETGYGLEVDMWACGVITYILLCGFPPFRSLDRNQEELFQYIQAGEFEYLMPYWEGISDSSKDLIDHLLVVDTRRRWKAEDVLCHPWVLSHGNSKDLPTNYDEYRKELLRDLRAKGKQYAAEPLISFNHKNKEN